jgi:RNA polymerase sigma-70 factor, ECF subfamily
MSDPQATVSTESAASAVSDEALFLRFQENRGRQDFEEIVRRFQGFVFRSALCNCRNETWAEEVAQSVFFRIAKEKLDFKDYGAGSFRGWLFQMVTNTARVAMRSERRLSRREAMKRKQSAETAQYSPTDQHERQELLDALHQALFQLSEEIRTVITLHYLQGMSQLEIGKMLGISQSQVSRRIDEGLETVKRRMERSGVAMPVAVPVLLMESDLAQIPPSLTDKLAHLAGEINDPAAAVNFAAAGKVARPVWWWIVGSVATVSVLIFAAVKMTGSPPLLAPAAQIPGTVPVAARGPRLFYDFSDPDSAANFKIREGHWAYVSKGGPKGRGHMEVTSMKTLIEFPELIDNHQLEVTVIGRPDLAGMHPAGPFLGVSWSPPPPQETSKAAIFHNIGRPDGRANEWSTYRNYLSKDGIDFWTGDQRMTFIANESKGPSIPILAIRGRFQVASISIRFIKPGEAPDISRYLDAINRIPTEKRTGRVNLPEFPSAVQNEPVYVDFRNSL